MWWTGGERGRSERRGRWGILARSLSWTWWSMPPWRASNVIRGICRWPGWRGVDSKGAGSNLHDGQAADSARRDGCEQVREPRETGETRELPQGAQRDERDERDQRGRRARRARTARARRGDAGVHSHSLMISCPGRIVRSFQTSRSSFSTNRRILRTNNRTTVIMRRDVPAGRAGR